MRHIKNGIIALITVAIVALGANALAQSGKGWGGGKGYHGQGGHHRGYHGQGHHYQLSKEEYKQWEEKRAAFYTDTRDIRVNLYEKERELRNELAKDEPNVEKASQLQKEVSELQAQFDQKHIVHMIEMRKINPNFGRGYMRGGPKMGYRSHGGGHCRQ